MHQIPQLHRRVLHGALVMLERSAGKLARSVLRGLGGREPTWLPGAVLLEYQLRADLLYNNGRLRAVQISDRS
jgi:hypothetical protein